ncbi:hypothetical protein N9W41_00865 [bacterium]|nr:hypothetical protein [bacterium]
MECVTCTACIDVCDEVMEKVNKPKGLIKYSSEAGSKRKVARPRVFVYSILLIISVVSLVGFLSKRLPYNISFIRQKGAPFFTLENNEYDYSNLFKGYFKNHTAGDIKIYLNLDESIQDDGIKMVVPQNPIVLKPEQVYRSPIFIEFKKDYKYLKGSHLNIHYKITGKDVLYIYKTEFTLNYPEN